MLRTDVIIWISVTTTKIKVCCSSQWYSSFGLVEGGYDYNDENIVGLLDPISISNARQFRRKEINDTTCSKIMMISKILPTSKLSSSCRIVGRCGVGNMNGCRKYYSTSADPSYRNASKADDYHILKGQQQQSKLSTSLISCLPKRGFHRHPLRRHYQHIEDHEDNAFLFVDGSFPIRLSFEGRVEKRDDIYTQASKTRLD